MVRDHTISFRTQAAPARRALPRARAAFTLVELVLAMVVMSILLAGMSSAMILASRALPDDASVATAVREGYQALERMGDELQTAQVFTTKSPTIVQFAAPDRDADSSPEIIRYSWSGSPGHALMRKYNSQTAVEFVNDVRAFQIVYTAELVDDVSRTTEVRVVLQIGPDAAGRVELATQIMNQPVN